MQTLIHNNMILRFDFVRSEQIIKMLSLSVRGSTLVVRIWRLRTSDSDV